MNILILKFMFVIVALTARAGQYIFCEQVVRVNQGQFHFGDNKLVTLFSYSYLIDLAGCI